MPRVAIQIQSVHPIRVVTFKSGDKQCRQVIERKQYERDGDQVLVDEDAFNSFKLAADGLGFRGEVQTHHWADENVMFLVVNQPQ